MLSLLYMSASSHPMQPDELEQMLVEARVANAKADITGLLLYKDGHFMQALEGPDAEVRDLFARITADSRHYDVKRLAEKQVDQRQFARWSMGFRVVDEAQARAIPGYDDFFSVKPFGERNMALATREELLLEWFRTH